MKKRILACLLKLAEALKAYAQAKPLNKKAVDAFEAELQSLSISLRALGRELTQARARLGPAPTPEEAAEHASFDAQVTALVELRGHAAFGLRVVQRLRIMGRDAIRYLDGGLVDLATGQRLLGTFAYHRHELEQFYRRCRRLDAVEAFGTILPVTSKNVRIRLRDIAIKLLDTDKRFTDEIEAFERQTVQASQAFAADRPAVASILPCGMPGLSGMAPPAEPIECIAVYRGLHYRRDYFGDYDVLNQVLASLDQIPASSEEVRRRAGVEPGLVETQARMDALEREALDIARELRALEGTEVLQHWTGKTADRYYSLIQRYINTYGKFSTEIKMTTNVPALYRDLGFHLTPFVSFSFNPVHSIRYVLGIKTPAEQSAQRRREGHLGELYVYLIPLVPDNIQRLNNILQLASQGDLSIKARILNEAEVTVLGGMSSASLVGRLVVGHVGGEFYAPDEDVGTPMAQAQLDNWQEELAARAIGCAAVEAQSLNWKIVGYESLPGLSPTVVDNPYFGVANMPRKDAQLTRGERRAVNAQRKLTREITAFNKGFSSKGGSAKDIDWDAAADGSSSSGSVDVEEDEPESGDPGMSDDEIVFEPLPDELNPKSIAEFLALQQITDPDASLHALLGQYHEGSATPDGHNCLIHTLAQLAADNPNAMPDFADVRSRYQLPTGTTISIGSTGHVMARDLGLLVQVYAMGHGGRVQDLGAVGHPEGTPCAVLQFGAHFVPLWPKPPK